MISLQPSSPSLEDHASAGTEGRITMSATASSKRDSANLRQTSAAFSFGDRSRVCNYSRKGNYGQKHKHALKGFHGMMHEMCERCKGDLTTVVRSMGNWQAKHSALLYLGVRKYSCSIIYQTQNWEWQFMLIYQRHCYGKLAPQYTLSRLIQR